MMHHPGLFVGPTLDKGKGVFTHTEIHKDDVIEICPVIILSAEEKTIIHGTGLHDYYFLWGEDSDEAAIALGYGSLYNHSSDPNAKFEVDLQNQSINIYCRRDIKAGEEITINYITDHTKGATLWFEEK